MICQLDLTDELMAEVLAHKTHSAKFDYLPVDNFIEHCLRVCLGMPLIVVPDGKEEDDSDSDDDCLQCQPVDLQPECHVQSQSRFDSAGLRFAHGKRHVQ